MSEKWHKADDKAHIVFGVVFLYCLDIVGKRGVPCADGVEDMREKQRDSPCAEMKKCNHGILTPADRQIFIRGGLRIENEISAFRVMAIKPAKLIEVSVFFPAFGVDNGGIVVLKLVCENVYFVEETDRARDDLLLKKQVFFRQSDCILAEADFQWDIAIEFRKRFPALRMKQITYSDFQPLLAVQDKRGLRGKKGFPGAETSGERYERVILYEIRAEEQEQDNRDDQDNEKFHVIPPRLERARNATVTKNV